jgi:hypothetical protein
MNLCNKQSKGNTFMIIFKIFQQQIFFICTIYPVYGKEKLNWPSLPRFLFLKHIFLFSFSFIVYYKDKFIIAINFFLSLAIFRFILNKLPFKWYKIPIMLLEKVSIHTEIIFVHRNTTNSFIPLGSNIQFSTNTEKEQVIIKKKL